jgi:hypothetical protein
MTVLFTLFGMLALALAIIALSVAIKMARSSVRSHLTRNATLVGTRRQNFMGVSPNNSLMASDYSVGAVPDYKKRYIRSARRISNEALDDVIS